MIRWCVSPLLEGIGADMVRSSIVLTITIDEASHVVDGKLQIPDIFEKTIMANGSGFDSLLNESIGQHWNFLVNHSDVYSVDHEHSLLHLFTETVHFRDRVAAAKVHNRCPFGRSVTHSIPQFCCC